MNKDRFYRVMSAIDPEFLEEAKTPVKKRSPWTGILAAAACLFLMLGVLYWQTQPPTAPEQYGYTLSLPRQAKDVVWTEVHSDPAMLQATFRLDGNSYVCRTAHVGHQADISGITGQSAGSMQWQSNDLSLSFNQNSDADSWMSWYDESTQNLWCLSGADPVSLLATASQIIESMGYHLAVVPEGATDITYHALGLDGHTVGEVSFVLNKVRWSYRMAATMELEADFRDISGQEDAYANESETQVAWCSARLSWNEDGFGKLVWFDLVPGLLYSLTMDSGASEQALMDMAAQLYEPAQDDIG
jgi:hypothetical protein